MFKFHSSFAYRIPRRPMDAFTLAPGTELDDFLRDQLRQPAVAEAIYLSSPEFYREVEQYLGQTDYRSGDPRKLQRFRMTALKYLNRLSYRPTPFASFAACGSSTIASSDTPLAPATAPEFERVLKLDTAYLVYLANRVHRIPDITRYLRLYPNNTIDGGRERARYVEMIDADRGRAYNLSTFQCSEYTDAILAGAAAGATGEALARVITDAEVSLEDALEFVGELHGASILISELEPGVVGPGYQEELSRKLLALRERVPAGTPVHAELDRYVTHLTGVIKALETPAATGKVADYRAVEESVTAFHGEAYPNVLRLDSRVTGAVKPQIDFKLARDIQKGLKAFIRLSYHHASGEVGKFRERFSQRYEERFVPILEALDPELGIGFAGSHQEHYTFAPLVDNLPLAPRVSGNTRKRVEWDYVRHAFFLRRITQAVTQGEKTITLTDADLDRFQYDPRHIPPTSAALCKIVPRAGEPPLIAFQELGKDSGTALLSRFAHTDEGLDRMVRELSDFEDECFGGCALAEVNHLANLRIGNITERPRARRHEIAFVTKSNYVEDETLIPVQHIYVGVRGGKVVLVDQRNGQQIVPRLSTAHNYQYNCLPLYKFLALLQEEHHGGYYEYMLDLGPIASMVDHIPRIQYRNFVFRPASWNIKTIEVRKLKEQSFADFQADAIALFRERGWPERFFVREKGKTPLFIDVHNPAGLYLFSNLLSAPKLLLTEAVGYDAEQWLSPTTGAAFNHEVLLPFRNEVFKQDAPARRYRITPEAGLPRRKLVPGQEWVYFKLYCGVNACEKLVGERLRPLLEGLRERRLINRFFFLRLVDPDYHLRLRVAPRDYAAVGEILRTFNAYFRPEIEAGTIWKVQIDTYRRELERYGGVLTVPSEDLFDVDSRAVVGLKSLLTAEVRKSEEWILSLRMASDYVRAFFPDPAEAKAFLAERRGAFADLFNTNKLQKRQLTQRFLNHRPAIERALLKDEYVFENATTMRGVLRDFRTELDDWIRTHLPDADFALRSDLAASYIHMSILRFVSSKNKLHEHVFYQILERVLLMFEQRARTAAHAAATSSQPTV